MKANEKPMGMLIRFPFLDGWVTYGTDQLEQMTPEQLAAIWNLPVSPGNPLADTCKAAPTVTTEIDTRRDR
jgi:hypothetical protein